MSRQINDWNKSSLSWEKYIFKNKVSLKSGIVIVSVEIDDQIGFLKLKSMGVEIDKLTDEQYKYIHAYEEGT